MNVIFCGKNSILVFLLFENKIFRREEYISFIEYILFLFFFNVVKML